MSSRSAQLRARSSPPSETGWLPESISRSELHYFHISRLDLLNSHPIDLFQSFSRFYQSAIAATVNPVISHPSHIASYPIRKS